MRRLLGRRDTLKAMGRVFALLLAGGLLVVCLGCGGKLKGKYVQATEDMFGKHSSWIEFKPDGTYMRDDGTAGRDTVTVGDAFLGGEPKTYTKER